VAASSHAVAASGSSVVTPRLALCSRYRHAWATTPASRGAAVTSPSTHPADAASVGVEQLGNTLLQTAAGERRADRQLAPVGDR
jgi:hypothetical protein